MALQKEEALLFEQELPTDYAHSSPIDTFHVVIDEPAVEKATPASSHETPISYSAISSVPARTSRREPNITIISDDTIGLKNGEIKLQGDSLFVFNALLAYRNKSLRAEEIRALGFKDKETVTATRLRFKNVVAALISKVNTLAEDELITKTGVTKGTRYQISEHTEIEDARKEMMLIGENPSYLERAQVITELTKKYKDHPYVQQQLFSYRDANHNSTMRVGSDEVNAYLKEIGTYRLLTKDEEVKLFGDIEKGLEHYAHLSSLENATEADTQALLNLVAAREIIFNTNLRLAVKMSRPYWRVRGTMSVIDVIQEANCGIAAAIPRMKIEKGFKFSTYATLWIKQSVRRALSNQSREIRLPTHVHETYSKVKKDVRELAIMLGREPTDNEIEQSIKMPLDKYRDLMRIGKLHLPSLNQLVDEYSDTELGDFLARTEDDHSQQEDNEERTQLLTQILTMSSLDDREKLVIGLRYGLKETYLRKLKVHDKSGKNISINKLLAQDTFQGSAPLKDVGNILGISAERIRQIEMEAMDELKRAAKRIER